MFIGIAATIPDLPNLPGQGGGGPEVTLDYSSSNFCADASDPTLSDASPVGGVFSYTGVGTLDLNTSTGAIDISGSDPGNYTVIYTVVGVGSSNFPINIGAVIDTTITGDSATCIGSAPSPADLTAVSGYSNYEWFKDNVSVQSGASNTYTPAFNVAGSFVYKVTITDNSLSTPCTDTSSNFTFTVNALPTISIAGGNFCSGSTSTLTATASSGTAFVWELDTGSGFNVISGQTNNTISVNSDGEYRAKVTDANGCTSAYSNILSISEFASPSVTIATVPGTTICTGDTATLTANVTGGTGTISYLWSNSATTQAISVAPTTTTTYTVTVTDGNDCTATASQEITPSTNATAIASIDNDAAMSFNGTDQYITFPEFSISNAFTLSCWINPDTVGSGFHAIVADGSVTNTYIRFGDAGGGTLIDVVISGNGSGGIARINSGATISTGNWQHLVVKRNSSNVVTIYHNGTAYTNQTPTLPGTFTFSQIGKTGNSSVPSYFDGKLDEVAVFNTALSSCDIKGIYEGSIGSNAGKAANLLDANTTIPAPVYWNRMGDS